MPKNPLPITTFQDISGNPIANGSIAVNLSDDAKDTATSVQVCASSVANISLNSSGVIVGSPTFWENSGLSPSGTFYLIKVYSSNGQLVAGPISVTVS